MHASSENSLSSLGKTKTTILIITLILLPCIVSLTIIQTTSVNRNSSSIVIRVDDIQDFAFKEAQLFLLKSIASESQPLSLAIIAGMFGEDSEILDAVRSAVASGCEVGIHGWEHENLTSLKMTAQMSILFQAKIRIKDLLGVETRLLIPPMFSYDNNTVSAMHHESYSIISTCTDYHEPNSVSGITNIPATVELSTLSNDIWQMKNIEAITAEVERSVELFGYAVIVTHPQEFLANGRMNQTATESFTNLLATLNETYQFTTIENLYLQKPPS